MVKCIYKCVGRLFWKFFCGSSVQFYLGTFFKISPETLSFKPLCLVLTERSKKVWIYLIEIFCNFSQFISQLLEQSTLTGQQTDSFILNNKPDKRKQIIINTVKSTRYLSAESFWHTNGSWIQIVVNIVNRIFCNIWPLFGRTSGAVLCYLFNCVPTTQYQEHI